MNLQKRHRFSPEVECCIAILCECKACSHTFQTASFRGSGSVVFYGGMQGENRVRRRDPLRFTRKMIGSKVYRDAFLWQRLP